MGQSALGVPLSVTNAAPTTQELYARTHCVPEPQYISRVNLATDPNFEQGLNTMLPRRQGAEFSMAPKRRQLDRSV